MFTDAHYFIKIGETLFNIIREGELPENGGEKKSGEDFFQKKRPIFYSPPFSGSSPSLIILNYISPILMK